jgi:hypothetical protein
MAAPIKQQVLMKSIAGQPAQPQLKALICPALSRGNAAVASRQIGVLTDGFARILP